MNRHDKMIKKMIKFRNKLFARKKRQPNNANVTEPFNKFRNRINREIIQSKKSYFTNYFKDCEMIETEEEDLICRM